MIKNLLQNYKAKIAVLSLIFAANGVANILLLRLLSGYVKEVNQISAAIAVFVSGMLAVVLLTFFSSYFLGVTTAAAVHEIRTHVAEGIRELSHAQLMALNKHKLYTTLTNDVETLSVIMNMFPNIVYNVTLLISGLVYLFFLSPMVLVASFSILLLGFVVAKSVIVKRGMEQIRRLRETQDKLFGVYTDVLEGAKELEFNDLRKRKYYDHHLKSLSKEYQGYGQKKALFFSVLRSWGSCILFTLLASAVFVSQSFLNLPEAVVFQYFVTLVFLMTPITGLLAQWQSFAGWSIISSRLNQLDLPSPVNKRASIETFQNQDLSHRKDLSHRNRPFSNLVFDNVSFTYFSQDDNEGYTVGPINLKVQTGKILFLVGGNGSGKTTTAKLLTGLLKPTSGKVLLNGEEITEINRHLLVDQFSAVFSDHYLFEEIINKHGLHVSDSSVENYLSILRLSKKVRVENGLLSTTNLSQGQRKRLGLLQAIFDDANCLLLDELAAEQDPEFRDYFYRTLLSDLNKQGKTVIVISHDDKYFFAADRIIRFEEGKIVD